ncbi:DUF1850 domain-containing protein [Gracilibacillus caseinilyticus]|uniref:DUF1850 domain-containing protein n=1 Tax=Gracilibacillus caseinilyticus TaxID=2932256 RepID=A0ABY4EZU8_9BACI|nr:DUF1850 domain-containing protein [Gracilibacillus caseinilyticus]UOQ49383.1 DUF1850 domain-containing protein [Gracilibacillus caseinilyticus]
MNNNSQQERALLFSNAPFRKAGYIVLIICSFVIGWFFWQRPHYLLEITDRNTDEVLWSAEIDKNETFSHEYVHSVEKSPVKEVFQFSSTGEMLTMESWTKSFGAGMPYAREGDVEMEDGYYILRNLNRPIQGGIIRMKPSNLYPHRFTFRQDSFYLSKEPFVRKIIEIDVRTLTWWEGLQRSFTL